MMDMEHLALIVDAYADNSLTEKGDTLYYRKYVDLDNPEYVPAFTGTKGERMAYRLGIKQAASLIKGWAKLDRSED